MARSSKSIQGKLFRGPLAQHPDYEARIGAVRKQQLAAAQNAGEGPHIMGLALKGARGEIPEAVMEAQVRVPNEAEKGMLAEATELLKHAHALVSQEQVSHAQFAGAKDAVTAAIGLFAQLDPNIGGLVGDGGAERMGLRARDGLAIARQALEEGNAARALDEIETALRRSQQKVTVVGSDMYEVMNDLYDPTERRFGFGDLREQVQVSLTTEELQALPQGTHIQIGGVEYEMAHPVTPCGLQAVYGDLSHLLGVPPRNAAEQFTSKMEKRRGEFCVAVNSNHASPVARVGDRIHVIKKGND